MNSNYSTYLSSRAWSEKRQQRLQLSKFQCEACGTKRLLQVHHLTYERIFQEDMLDLMVLCRLHHEAVEEMIQKGAIKRFGDVKTLRLQTLNLVADKTFSFPEINIPKAKSSRGVRKNYQRTKKESAALVYEWMRTLPRPEFKKRIQDLFSHIKKPNRRNGILVQRLNQYDAFRKRCACPNVS